MSTFYMFYNSFLFFFKPLWKLLVDMVSKFFNIIMLIIIM